MCQNVLRLIAERIAPVCLLSRVSCVTAHVSRLLFYVSCLTPLVSSLQSQISCHMSPVLRVLKYKIISELVAQLAVVRN